MTTKDGILFVGSHSCDLTSLFSLFAIQHKIAQSLEIETTTQNQQKGRKSKILQEVLNEKRWKEKYS